MASPCIKHDYLRESPLRKQQSYSASLIHSESDNVRVQHRCVERCDVEVEIGQHDCDAISKRNDDLCSRSPTSHSPVDDAIVSVNKSFRLKRISLWKV